MFKKDFYLDLLDIVTFYYWYLFRYWKKSKFIQRNLVKWPKESSFGPTLHRGSISEFTHPRFFNAIQCHGIKKFISKWANSLIEPLCKVWPKLSFDKVSLYELAFLSVWNIVIKSGYLLKSHWKLLLWKTQEKQQTYYNS